MSLKAQEEVIVNEEIDNKTGEIIKQNVQRTVRGIGKATEEPAFVKLYIKAWCAFKDLNGVNHKFLYQIMQYMSYADKGQEIIMNAAVKKRIAENLNWSKKTSLNRVNVELNRLCKVGILKKTASGIYAVNPELIAKGNWPDVKKFQATFKLIGPDAGTVVPEME